VQTPDGPATFKRLHGTRAKVRLDGADSNTFFEADEIEPLTGEVPF
jgi:hypothetical protein